MGLRITILLSLALLTRICAAQETVTVRGRVTRSDSGAPVEDANVMLCRSVTDLGGAQPDRPRRGAADDTLAQAERRPEPLVREKLLPEGRRRALLQRRRPRRQVCVLPGRLALMAHEAAGAGP